MKSEKLREMTDTSGHHSHSSPKGEQEKIIFDNNYFQLTLCPSTESEESEDVTSQDNQNTNVFDSDQEMDDELTEENTYRIQMTYPIIKN